MDLVVAGITFPLQLRAFRMVQAGSIRPFQSADVGDCHLDPRGWNMALEVARGQRR